MPSLPIRPLAFIAANVGLFVLASALMFTGPGFFVYGLPIQVALMGLQLVWVWQALRFATGQLRLRGGDARAALNHKIALAMTVCLLVGLIPFVVFLGFTSPFANQGAPPPAVAICVPIGVLGTIGLYWIAARSLVDAERAAGVGSPHVLGTAIQFFYLFFAAPFLYRRLKALAGAERQAAPQAT